MLDQPEEGDKFKGYRWIADNTDGSCPKCSAMEGKEFYKNPQPGQLSLDDMPELPLHPNCNCQLQILLDCDSIAEEPEKATVPPDNELLKAGQSRFLYEDAVEFLGVIFCNDGRSFFDGPAHGNWCGKNWDGGRNNKMLTQSEREKRKGDEDPPMDSLDALCQIHDGGYVECQEVKRGDDEDCTIPADRDLLAGAIALDEDPSKWTNPPKTPEAVAYAKRYIAGLKWWFGGNVARYDSYQLTKQEWNIRSLPSSKVKANGLRDE
jgi:hypothetical protein